jgi:hypothetical protein
VYDFRRQSNRVEVVSIVNDKGRYRQEHLMIQTFVQRLGPTALYLPDLTKKWLPENPGEGPSRTIEANVLYHAQSRLANQYKAMRPLAAIHSTRLPQQTVRSYS